MLFAGLSAVILACCNDLEVDQLSLGAEYTCLKIKHQQATEAKYLPYLSIDYYPTVITLLTRRFKNTSPDTSTCFDLEHQFSFTSIKYHIPAPFILFSYTYPLFEHYLSCTRSSSV